MKTLLLVFLLSGCASKCPDCLTLTPKQLYQAVEKAYIQGYVKGHDDGEDAANRRRLKSL